MKKLKKPELLAPAGDWSMLITAINSGANAVYFGVEKLNMRAKAHNFKLDELSQIVEYCHSRNVEAHLTLNSIVYELEINELDEIISTAKKSGVDLIICWDFSVISKCREYEMPFCVSTQASISNSNSAKMFQSLGAKRIVLARECTLEQIKEIRKNVDIEIEAFIHGAMCVAISGRCFMSHSAFGFSANRGECIQPCRREYEIYDKDGDVKFLIGEDYVMSPKDLCSIKFIDQLIEAGIDSFKIEGRKRSPEYISKTVSVYRKAIDDYFNDELTHEAKEKYFIELQKVYNRGFSTGFYFGTPDKDDFATQYGSVATTKKVYVGKVLNYFKKTKIVHAKLEAADVSLNDEILIIGNKTGAIECKLSSLYENDIETISAKRGSEITFPCESEVKIKDQIYKIVEVEKK